MEIGLDQHAEVVGDISSAASKELAIEQVMHTYHINIYMYTATIIIVSLHFTVLYRIHRQPV